MYLVFMAAAAAELCCRLRPVAVPAMRMPMIVPRMRVPMAAQDGKDEDIDAHANQRQDEHHCAHTAPTKL